MANKKLKHPKSSTAEKPSRLLNFYHFLGVVQAVIIVFGAGAMLYLRQLDGDAAVGANLVFGLLFSLLALISLALALIVLIGLPVYLNKHRLQHTWQKRSTLTLIISIVVLSFIMWSSFGPREQTDYEKWAAGSAQRAQQAEQDAQNEYLNSTMGKEITKKEAIVLFNKCQVHEFSYENQRKKYTGEWGELSSTGVVTAEIVGDASTHEKVILVHAISVSDKLAPELLPVAQAAQKACKGVEIYKNGILQQGVSLGL